MANANMNSFFPTLVAAAADYNKVFAPSNAAVDAVYRDVSTLEGYIGQTINVPIPAVSTASDVGAGSFSFPDLSNTNHPITLSHNAQDGFLIRSFEQWTSPEQLKTVFVDSKIKSVLTNIDQAIVALANTTNFNVNALVTQAGSTAHLIDTVDFLQARQELATSKVPITEMDNMTFLCDEVVYHAMLNDNNWIQAYQIGGAMAEQIRESGIFMRTYGTNFKYDQNFTTTGSAGAYVHSALLMHRYAIALVSRRMPPPDNPAILWADIDVKGLPFRIMTSYDHASAGWRVSVNCGYGVAVIRPECGVVIQTRPSA